MPVVMNEVLSCSFRSFCTGLAHTCVCLAFSLAVASATLTGSTHVCVFGFFLGSGFGKGFGAHGSGFGFLINYSFSNGFSCGFFQH